MLTEFSLLDFLLWKQFFRTSLFLCAPECFFFSFQFRFVESFYGARLFSLLFFE